MVTLIPYGEARRLKVAAIAASDTEVTVLAEDPQDRETIATLEEITGMSIAPIETSVRTIDLLLDRLSGCVDDGELWLQSRHIHALSRLVDHSVNLRHLEEVRSLVDRALEFAPYSAEIWLMKARISTHRRDVVHALRIASQIAPNDRRILRWAQSMNELAEASGTPTEVTSAPTIGTVPQVLDKDLEPTKSEGLEQGSDENEPTIAAVTIAPSEAREPSLDIGVAHVDEPSEVSDASTTTVEPESVQDLEPDEDRAEPTTSSQPASQAPVAVADRPVVTEETSSAQDASAQPEAESAPRLRAAPGDLPVAEGLAAAIEISRIRDMRTLLERVSKEMREVTAASSVTTFFRRQNSWSGFSTNPELQDQLLRVLPKSNRLAAQVVKLGVPAVITNTDLRLEDVGTTIREAGVRSFALLPIQRDGEIGGLIYINYAETDRANDIFGSDLGRTIELILSCAGLAAAAIDQRAVVEESSTFDPLTGAYNLRQLEHLLSIELDRAKRYRYSVALLSFDVDDFAEVNRKFSEELGSQVLRHMAQRVLELGRTSDALARHGADDFMLMLPQTTGKGAETMARRMHEAFEKPIVVDGFHVYISLSIGMASFPERADDATQLLHAAEIALYSAKAQGKNRTTVADTLSLGS